MGATDASKTAPGEVMDSDDEVGGGEEGEDSDDDDDEGEEEDAWEEGADEDSDDELGWSGPDSGEAEAGMWADYQASMESELSASATLAQSLESLSGHEGEGVDNPDYHLLSQLLASAAEEGGASGAGPVSLLLGQLGTALPQAQPLESHVTRNAKSRRRVDSRVVGS